MKKLKQIIIYIALLLIVGVLCFCFYVSSDGTRLDTSMYQYYDTKELLHFVNSTALMLEKDGVKGLEFLKKNRELYKTKDSYLYVYDFNGSNLFHAGITQLENQNLINFEDSDGKPVLVDTIAALNNTNNPHGWVHYTWWKHKRLYPVPKSSCNLKVTLPNGQQLFVGGGIDYPHEEQEFIRIVVDSAVDALKKDRKQAFEELKDLTSPYNFRNVRVFLFDNTGELLVSPVSNKDYSHLTINECVDEVGHKPFVKALKELETKDTTWEIFTEKNRYERNLIKKSLYIRKMDLDGKTIYVGAITDLPHPI